MPWQQKTAKSYAPKIVLWNYGWKISDFPSDWTFVNIATYNQITTGYVLTNILFLKAITFFN